MNYAIENPLLARREGCEAINIISFFLVFYKNQ